MLGYALRKVLKVAPIIILVIFPLIVLAYANLIDGDFDRLSESTSTIINAINPTFNRFTPLFVHIPLIANLIFGLFLEFRRGYSQKIQCSWKILILK